MSAVTLDPICRGRVNRHSTARHVTLGSQDVLRGAEAALAHHLGAISQSPIFRSSVLVVEEGGHVDVDFEVVPASDPEELPLLEKSTSLEALHRHSRLPECFDLLHRIFRKPYFKNHWASPSVEPQISATERRLQPAQVQLAAFQGVSSCILWKNQGLGM